MTNVRCEAIHWMVPILTLGIILIMYIPFCERVLLYILCIGTTLTHWHYGSNVVSNNMINNEL